MNEIEFFESEDVVGEKIFSMRRSGFTIQEAAQQLSIDVDEAISLYNQHRNRIAKTTMSRDEAKDLMVARYEGLLRTWYDAAAGGDEEAIKHVLAILKDESKVLGLDQLDPVDHQTTNHILIMGENKEAFIQALQEGRGERKELVEGETIDEEEASE